MAQLLTLQTKNHFAASKWINYADYHKGLLTRWTKWFTNIEHDTKSRIITLDIDSTSDVHGTFQEPFHVLSVVDTYAFPILYTISDLLFSKETNPFKNYTFHKDISDIYKPGTKTPGSAAIGEHIRYNKICATHPTRLVLQYTFYNKNGKTTADFEFYFMSNAPSNGIINHLNNNNNNNMDPMRLNAECIAYLKHQWAFIEIDKYTEKVQSKRIRDPPSKEAMETFGFVEPHFVGKSNPNQVFLGQFLVDRSISCLESTVFEGRYYAEGILNHETGFNLHPFIDGSGDHLNASLLTDIVYQFANLVVRNGGGKYELLEQFFARIGRFDDKVKVTVVDAHISFIKYMELNAFKMVLEELKYIGNGDERMKALHFRPTFAFEMTVALHQFDQKRSVVKALVVPLFRVASL